MSDDREIWAGHNGMVLENVHPYTACEGRGCPIHHPSDHHMKDWPLNWRNDRGLMERLCPCGIGHPDPDDLAFKQRVLGDRYSRYAWDVHGCCGHCRAEAAA